MSDDDHPATDDGPIVELDSTAALAEIAGQLNLVNARLVAVTERVLATGEWHGPGVHSPSQWLAWQTGISPERAREIVFVAEHRAELPTLVHEFDHGLLSFEQMKVLAKAPAWADEMLHDIAHISTVTQLRRLIRPHMFEGDPDEPESPPTPDDRNRVSFGTRDGRWRLRGDYDLATGRRIEAAIVERKDAMFEDGQTDVTWADALAECTERSLDRVESPARRDRYRVWFHLDVASGTVTTTDGWRIPMALEQHLLCDGVLQPVWERDGLPVSVGRTQRIVPERTRRAVEQRDRGCRVPGCGADRFVEVHHIIHWLDGGPTDTWNLICLCPKHHRLHHQGKLGITGNADIEQGVTFTDWAGKVIGPNGQPIPPSAPPPVPNPPYRRPLGLRFDYHWIGPWRHPNRRRQIADRADAVRAARLTDL